MKTTKELAESLLGKEVVVEYIVGEDSVDETRHYIHKRKYTAKLVGIDYYYKNTTDKYGNIVSKVLEDISITLDGKNWEISLQKINKIYENTEIGKSIYSD